MSKSCLIIGAGLSGLTAARELQSRGVMVQVVDKGRGVGGRMVTRRLERDGEVAVFDHGAQFFTARSAEFQSVVNKWTENRMAREWFRGGIKVLSSGEIEHSADGHPRFAATNGMASLLKAQAADLNVLCNQRITALDFEDNQWRAQSESGQSFRADSLLLTSPVPQSLALLQTVEERDFVLPTLLQSELEVMKYESCIAAMMWLDGPGRVPAPGALSFESGPITWLADNFQKGISPAAGALTIHAAPDWSREHWSDSDEQIVAALSDITEIYLGTEIRAHSVARWKFSKPIAPRNDGCLFDAKTKLGCASDAFGGAKIEGAFLSGLAAARKILALE